MSLHVFEKDDPEARAVTVLVLGGGALLGVFTIMQQRTGAPPTITSDSILFSEQSVLFSLSDHSPSDLKRTLAAARNSSNGTLGSITRIIPVITVSNPDGEPQNRAELAHCPWRRSFRR